MQYVYTSQLKVHSLPPKKARLESTRNYVPIAMNVKLNASSLRKRMQSQGAKPR